MVRRIVDVDLPPTRRHGKQSAIVRVLHVRYPSLGVADLSRRRTSAFGFTIYVASGEKGTERANSGGGSSFAGLPARWEGKYTTRYILRSIFSPNGA